MKTFIVALVFSVFLLVGGIFFIQFNFTHHAVNNGVRYVSVKFTGVNYPYRLVYAHGTTLGDALRRINVINVREIKHEVNRHVLTCSPNDLVASGVYQIERWAN